MEESSTFLLLITQPIYSIFHQKGEGDSYSKYLQQEYLSGGEGKIEIEKGAIKF